MTQGGEGGRGGDWGIYRRLSGDFWGILKQWWVFWVFLFFDNEVWWEVIWIIICVLEEISGEFLGDLRTPKPWSVIAVLRQLAFYDTAFFFLNSINYYGYSNLGILYDFNHTHFFCAHKIWRVIVAPEEEGLRSIGKVGIFCNKWIPRTVYQCKRNNSIIETQHLKNWDSQF